MNVWPLRSQYACSQVSTVLFNARTVEFVRAQICVGDMRVSHSQIIGLVIARSARPAPPALSERNECIRETLPLKLFKVQSSNFKSLQKTWGGPGRPSCPASNGHVVGCNKGFHGLFGSMGHRDSCLLMLTSLVAAHYDKECF